MKVASRCGVNPNQVSLIYAKADGNFNKEISMVRGNEVNEFSATITDVAGEETVNFYFTSVAETVYPFNTPNSSISIVDPTVFVDTPEIIGFAQNYPNLFNPSTRISYKIICRKQNYPNHYQHFGTNSPDSNLRPDHTRRAAQCHPGCHI